MVRAEGGLGYCWDLELLQAEARLPRAVRRNGKLERLQPKLLIPGGGIEGRKSGEELRKQNSTPPGPRRAPETLDGGSPDGQQIPFLQRTCPARIKSLALALACPCFPSPVLASLSPSFPIPEISVVTAACCGEPQDHAEDEPGRPASKNLLILRQESDCLGDSG